MVSLIVPMIVALGPVQQPVNPKAGKKLVFNQDFSRLRKIDPKVWLFDDGPVYNGEAQKYTKQEARNAWIEKGALVIEARKADGKITSGRLQSLASWKYGYIEAIAELPKGKGTWPAFWMLGDKLRIKGAGNPGWPKCGEIDIMEQIGADPKVIHFSLHSGKINWMRKEQRTKVVSLADPTGYHAYAMNWTPKFIEFYLDGKPVYRVDKTENSVDAWPFDDKFYIILNLAIGGMMGGAIDDSIFPCQYRIKSVRVWQ